MIRVLLADDHAVIRTGIRNILHKTPDIVVIGEASDGNQALKMAQELDPDVLVLDMEMPGLKGYEVANKLLEEEAGLPVLALSAHEDRSFILSVLGDGVNGYLTKDEVPDTLVRAIRGVAQGERGWVSWRVAARIAVWMQAQYHDHLNLTQQDLHMLRLMLAGKSSAQISQTLDVPALEVDARLL